MRGGLTRVFLDGRPAAGEDLRALALVNYGHFTTVQVRAGTAQGMDLHLSRLCGASEELFGRVPAADDLRRQLRQALQADGRDDCTLRATVFAPGFDPLRGGDGVQVEPRMLVAVSPPLQPPAGPVRVRSFRHLRAVPHLKHVGTFDLFHHRRLAAREGFDDALFADSQGRVLEGTTWNVGFISGDGVLWPQGPALSGVTRRLLQDGLAAAGVAQQGRSVALDELPAMRGAFACNTRGVWMLAGINAVAWPAAPEWAGRLAAVLSGRPRQRI